MFRRLERVPDALLIQAFTHSSFVNEQKINKKQDIYTVFIPTYFVSDNTVLNASYGGKNIVSEAINVNLRTRYWFIPNATVYDTDFGM